MQDDYQLKFADYCERQIDTLTPLNENPDLIMDPHQQEAMQLAAIALAVNRKAFSIVHSCGSGKTILEANLAIASQRAKQELGLQDSHDVILTTERSLLHMIREEFDFLGLDTGIWGGGKKVLDRPLIVSSIQAMQKNKKDLAKLLPSERVRLLIGDEADMFLTDERKEIINGFQYPVKVGLTATSKWPDGRDISEIWGEKIHEMNLKEGILKGINVPPLFYLFEADLDDSQLNVIKDDYDQKELQTALKEAEIQKAIPEVYEALVPKENRKNFPTLVYVPSVQLAYATTLELLQKLGDKGVTVRCWTGESMSSEQIKRDMTDFNDGKVDILVLCEMGGRGINLPRARCLIDAYPTLSSTKLEQRHGRVLRQIRAQSDLSQQGFKKMFALVAQIIPRSNRYRPYLLPDLLDCWPDFKEGRILGLQNSHGGFHGGDVGSPVQDEVAMIRQHLLGKNPQIYVREVEQVDIYEQLKLREELPQADEHGLFELDGERYGTINTWVREFGVNHFTIKKKLVGIEGVAGKDKLSRICEFYTESTVRERCSDFLENLPQADDNGFFEVGGERHQTIEGWAKELGVAHNSIKKRLLGIKGIRGRYKKGTICQFYSESLIRERCSDLLEDFLQADENGFFYLNGQQYGTIRAWAKTIGISSPTIKVKLNGVEGIRGKNIKGAINEFYPKSSIKEKCFDLLEDVPVSDENGFFELDGERYGSLYLWSKEFGVSRHVIFERLNGLEGINGKNKNGRIHKFYPESRVKKSCADLMLDLPKADESGFFELNEERYGAIAGWARELNISYRSIKKRLFGIKEIRGKSNKGGICDFYSESDIRNICADLLADLPKADENGFIEINGEKYGTIEAWARVLTISSNAIKKRLNELEGIRGKDGGGRICEFYAGSIVRERCSDFIENFLQADENGFIEVDGERHGTIGGWAKALDISFNSIKKRLLGIKGIKGKNKHGGVWDFYSESDIRNICVDLLVDLPHVDENGFVELNGEKYGTIEAWARELGKSISAIRRRFVEIEAISGKNNRSRICELYAESVVKIKCADFFNF